MNRFTYRGTNTPPELRDSSQPSYGGKRYPFSHGHSSSHRPIRTTARIPLVPRGRAGDLQRPFGADPNLHPGHFSRSECVWKHRGRAPVLRPSSGATSPLYN